MFLSCRRYSLVVCAVVFIVTLACLVRLSTHKEGVSQDAPRRHDNMSYNEPSNFFQRASQYIWSRRFALMGADINTQPCPKAKMSPANPNAESGNQFECSMHFFVVADTKYDHTLPVLIAVVTSPTILKTLGEAAYTTWVQDVSLFADRKVFWMFRYISSSLQAYKWYMKVDNDAFVNAQSLLLTLTALRKQLQDVSNFYNYVGQLASGRAHERYKLGLNGRKYCLGLGYVLSPKALAILAKSTESCLSDTKSSHSDTEVARCLWRTSPHMECHSPPVGMMKQIYYSRDGSNVIPMSLVESGQMKLNFPSAPVSSYFQATVLHPLKEPHAFYQFHKQIVKGLRPPQPPVESGPPDTILQAKRDIQKSCVHNPIFHQQLYKFVLPECPLDLFQETASQHLSDGKCSRFIRSLHVFIDDGNKQAIARRAVSQQMAYFIYLGASVHVVHQWMESLLSLSSIPQHLLIVAENKNIQQGFPAVLCKVLENPRCGLHLMTQYRGGAVVFRSVSTIKPHLLADAGHSPCYNVPKQSLGIGAILLHQSATETVISVLTGSHGQYPRSLADVADVLSIQAPSLQPIPLALLALFLILSTVRGKHLQFSTNALVVSAAGASAASAASAAAAAASAGTAAGAGAGAGAASAGTAAGASAGAGAGAAVAERWWRVGQPLASRLLLWRVDGGEGEGFMVSVELVCSIMWVRVRVAL
eukprot:gene11126-3186_t